MISFLSNEMIHCITGSFFSPQNPIDFFFFFSGLLFLLLEDYIHFFSLSFQRLVLVCPLNKTRFLPVFNYSQTCQGLQVPMNRFISMIVELFWCGLAVLWVGLASFGPPGCQTTWCQHCGICICMSNAGRIQNFGLVPAVLSIFF